MEKIKLIVDETKFYINEEKRTVACKMSGYVNFPYHNDGCNPFYTFNHIVDTVVATAKCHPDDDFDIEKGKRIARARAESKLYSKICKGGMRETMRYVFEFEAAHRDFLDKAAGVIVNNGNYIDKILGKEENDKKIVR